MGNRKKGILLFIVIMAFVTGMILLRHGHQDGHTDHYSKKLDISLIKCGYPEERDFLRKIQFVGKVVPERKIRLISPLEGIVTSVRAKDGDYVRKGKIIFQIGGKQIENRVTGLKNNIRGINKQIKIEKMILSTKERAFKVGFAKKDDLLLEKEKIISLRARLSSLMQELSSIQHISLIRSPLNGILTNPVVFEGQYVKKGEYLGNLMSKRLMVVADVFCPSSIQLQRKEAVLDIAGKKIRARVKHALYNRSKEGACTVWIKGDQLDRCLKPGQYVLGWIICDIHKRAISVPEDSVVQDQGGRNFVFVKKGNLYEKRLIKKGYSENGWVEVISGLSKKDMIVVQGAYELFYRDFSKSYKVSD